LVKDVLVREDKDRNSIRYKDWNIISIANYL
jgi:hypothetical protein